MLQYDLKHLRLKASLTQLQVANELGVHLRTYRRYENFECKLKINTHKQLVKILCKK